MNVSFGKIKCVKEVPNVTQNQMWIAKEISNAFGVDKETPYKYGANDYTGTEMTFAEYLEKQKGVDVVITAQKNNNVSVALKKTLFNKDGEKICTYTVKTNGCTPYEMTFNSKALTNPLCDVKNMLKKFVKRCNYFLTQ